MGVPLRPATIDVALSVLDQTPPDTAGPVGRITSLTNGQITKYLPATATPGVATASRVKIEQREGFQALDNTVRDEASGAVITSAPWTEPELLDSLDDQLVSINDSIPRVWNETSWTGYPHSRVVTRKLTQSTMVTAQGVLQASDSAWLGGVTLEVSTEISGTRTNITAGFRADNGAWVRTQFQPISPSEIARCTSDGTTFWLVCDAPASMLAIFVYDTNGVQLASTQVALTGTSWDIIAAAGTGNGIFLAQDDGAGHVTNYVAQYATGVITTASNTDTSMLCTGLLAYMTNKTDALSYIACMNTLALNVYQVTTQHRSHTFNYGSLAAPPDSLIGWTASETGVSVYVAESQLSSTAQTVGPKFDPRYRFIKTHRCTFANAATTFPIAGNIIANSRAFKIDDDYYAIAYYQGGPGLTQTETSTPVTWTSGDQMKGPAVQPLAFSAGDYQYGNALGISNSGTDGVTVGSGSAVYSFNAPPAATTALPAAYLSAIYTQASLTIAGASNSGNNGTFTVSQVQLSSGVISLVVRCAATTQVSESFSAGVTATLTPHSSSPDVRDTWVLGNVGGTRSVKPDASWIGENLLVMGTQRSANSGANAITDVANVSGTTYNIKLGSSAALEPEVIPNPPLPAMTVSLSLADPSTAYTFELQSITFDPSYVGATISVQGSGENSNNTVYQIQQVTGTHTVIATPLNQSTNQVNVRFPNTVVVTISFPQNVNEGVQQTWFLTPLLQPSGTRTAGRWEYGLAYADWRFDGQTPSNPYPMHVTSVVQTGTGLQVVLPYRQESFSAGVTTATGNIVDTPFATVGLKAFSLSSASGQSLTVAGELILPGPQASEFTASGFAEHGINLGFEMPFLVSQTNDGAITLGLTPGTAYQVIVVAECTDEDGDRIFSVTSPPLNFFLQSTNNTATYGGNLLLQTNRVYTISIYRTSIAGGSTTVRHYKITNDTDPISSAFTFPDSFTWEFKDQRPDAEILTSEVLYTDKGFLQRYPAPAFSQGVGTWKNRTLVLGYDGRVWMSGEKTAGDAVWFHPSLTFSLPTDDEPQALAAMDDYVLVLGARTNWYIPSTTFPDATGNNGVLPAPVQLPFANGCTGHAVTTRDGVIYSSTAGGPWLITRNLTNVWLGQSIQDSIGSTAITGITVDQKQRVYVATGGSTVYVWDTVPGAWYAWNLPSSARVISTWQGSCVYGDGSTVIKHSAGQYADTTTAGGTLLPISVAWTLAPLHLMGSVRGYGRCWAFQLQGEYKGPHFMNLTLGYGDEVDYQAPTVYPPFAASPTLSYLYEWNPQEEEASQFELSFVVSFDEGTPGNTATWELISFDVGVDTGIARVASQKRVPSG